MKKRENMIPVAEGKVRSATVKGKVSIYVNKEFWAPDIYVYHPFQDLDGVAEFPAEDESFIDEVVRILKGKNLIPKDSTYSMERAESGMQDAECAVFEVFEKDGDSDYAGLFCRKMGAKDLSRAEQKAERKRGLKRFAVKASWVEENKIMVLAKSPEAAKKKRIAEMKQCGYEGIKVKSVKELPCES